MADAYSSLTPVASNFWGAPVLRASDGTLFCPGFTGNTYSSRPHASVFIAVPYGAPSMPQTPGECEVICTRERDVDKKKKKGSDGARITLAGLEPASVDIRIKIWTPQQLLEFEKLCAIVFPPRQKQTTTKTVAQTPATTTQFFGSANQDGVTSGQTFIIPQVTTTKKVTQTKSVTVTQPFDVSHPILNGQGVKSLIFIKTDGPSDGPERGTKIFTLKAIEYLPPNKADATNTPTSSRGAAPLPSSLDNTGQPPGSNSANTGP